MKRLIVLVVGVSLVGAALALGTERNTSVQASCDGPATHTWKATVPGHLVREFTLPVCGPDAMSLYLNVGWTGNKDLLAYLVEPDGTVHRYLRQGRQVTASVGAPLDHGSWTVRVWNLSPGSAKTVVKVDLKE